MGHERSIVEPLSSIFGTRLKLLCQIEHYDVLFKWSNKVSLRQCLRSISIVLIANATLMLVHVHQVRLVSLPLRHGHFAKNFVHCGKFCVIDV